MRRALQFLVISIKVAVLEKRTRLMYASSSTDARTVDSIMPLNNASPFLLWNFKEIERRCQQIHPDHVLRSNHPREVLDCPS